MQDTSLEAFDSIKKDLSSLKERVFLVIIKENGLTCDEVELMLRLSHQTASARINDLLKENLIYDSGQRRKTRSNRNAIVWRCK